MKNLSAAILFLLVGFIPVVSYSQFLIVNSSQLNFGNIFENSPDSLPITLTNTIGRDVTVTSVRFYTIYGSPAFSASSTWFTIADGDSVTIWIKFSPKHNILHNSEMVIENDGLRGSVSVDLLGQGKYSDPYYNTTENLSEENLKQSIKQLTGSGYVSLGYNVARDSMFMLIDNKKANGQGAGQNTLECIYTGRQAIGYIDRTDCQTNFSFNTEHTFPQSLFTSMEPMRSDLHHLFPTDDLANSERGDNPFNNVAFPSWTNGGSESDGNYFEPRDLQKGPSARALFYFVLRYQNYNNFLNIQENALRNWHKAFPPSNIEGQRNNFIFGLQHNKNPFVNYPVFIDRITNLSANSVAPVVKSIDLPEDTVLYGTIQTGTLVIYKYVIVNNGNSNIQFTNFNLTHPSELGFAFGGNDTTISPGESLVLQISCQLAVADSIRGFLTFNTDATGNSFVSIPVFVNDPVVTDISEIVSGINIFPNPSQGNLKVSFNSYVEEVNWKMTDITGRIKAAATLETDGTIEFNGITPGIYILQLKFQDQLLNRRIIIQ